MENHFLVTNVIHHLLSTQQEVIGYTREGSIDHGR